MSNDNSGIKQKRYSLIKEEKEKIQNIQSVMGILALQREGLNNSLTLALMQARVRLNIKDSDAPEGFVRSVDFDSGTFEMIVTDVPMPKPPVDAPAEQAKPADKSKLN